ncbi:hypothetical protein Halha_0749 [Halobacteroides halobius DSM 5150]|uniref:Uncharacterized protein n=1 Tax=Halobacteroides halobius (strain ATCC 35273 / DSM 5150 / MD-1) TaxID=748449 RepID=L0K624_HALHC|nr:hypothetical protein [Halobacteroides halobius]AGB40722.1 hypothetical protein Halha_0749 [Halobacteroides halobius DSM 5150]
MIISLVWIYLFLILAVGMILVVPTEKIRDLLPFGLVGGFLVAIIIQYLAVNIFRLWEFNYALVPLAGFPLGVGLAWVPPEIVFGYFWPSLETKLTRVMYILFFAIVSTLLEYLFLLMGYRKYLNWNIYSTFLLAVVIHSALAYYLTSKEQLKT